MNKKKVYLYTIDGEFLREFETTDDCANYFGYDREYLYHNLKYCKKIRHKKERKWYVIKREKD